MVPGRRGRSTLPGHMDDDGMLDLPMLYRLLFYHGQDPQRRLVGDVAQLPPIGFGLTSHRVMQRSPPQIELPRTLRASDSGPTPMPLCCCTSEDTQQFAPTRNHGIMVSG